MQNEMSLTGYVTEKTLLQEGVTRDQQPYQYLELMLQTDERLPQQVYVRLWRSLAVQFSTIDLSPKTLIRMYLSLRCHTYADPETGEMRRANDVNCWKIEVLGEEGEVRFTCRR